MCTSLSSGATRRKHGTYGGQRIDRRQISLKPSHIAQKYQPRLVRNVARPVAQLCRLGQFDPESVTPGRRVEFLVAPGAAIPFSRLRIGLAHVR
jgi:hypothetical protein